MTTVAKKPPATGRETPTGTPARPSRTATSGAVASSAVGGVPRTRSVRSSTTGRGGAPGPASRRELPLGHGAASSIEAQEREETARAETVALLNDLKTRLGRAEDESDTYRRHTDMLQNRLDETLKEQSRLEERIHELEEQKEAHANEKREAAKKMREMEVIYEAERSSMAKEKEEMANREEEMQTVIQRLKDSLSFRNNNDDESRSLRQTPTHSPSTDSGSFAPASSIRRSDSRNNSKLVLQKDKLIESLRLELAEAQIKLVESENQGGGRLQEVERLLMEARMANARLMEDNESYQLLLQEKTLKGDFGTSNLSYISSSTNQDALAALEGRTHGTSLADELCEAADEDVEHHNLDHYMAGCLESELRAARDQNKALTLYINKIIERLLQHQEYEHILDKSNDVAKSPLPNVNKDLPPASKPSGPSLLQRAKTAIEEAVATGGGGASAKPRPRPMSYMPPTNPNGVTNNPQTAPSIPIGLGRSVSTARRPGRPMSEQFTGAANVVNAMCRPSMEGPFTAVGPLSPNLRGSGQGLSPNLRGSGQAFFANVGAAGLPGSRASSASGAPQSSSSIFPGMRSETSSVSEATDENSVVADKASQQSSPPRSHSSVEKNTTFAGGKPRPLRLIQENPDMQPAASKRSSWIGWASGLVSKKEGHLTPPGDVLRE